MHKFIKILGAVVVVILVLVVALVILAKVLITPERVKQTVLPLAEQNLHRKIELGDIAVSLFSGIELKGLKIYERDGSEAFVSTDLVRLKYQLLPLLGMKVVTMDSIQPDSLAEGQVGGDDVAAGYLAAKALAEAIGGEGSRPKRLISWGSASSSSIAG